MAEEMKMHTPIRAMDVRGLESEYCAKTGKFSREVYRYENGTTHTGNFTEEFVGWLKEEVIRARRTER